MALQLFKIASITVETPQATVSFSNIPSGYTDLMVVTSARSTNSNIFGGGQLRFNSDSTLNAYNTRRLYGDGASATSGTWNSGSDSQGILGWNFTGNTATTNSFSSQCFYIPNYTSSNYKSVSIDEVVENNATTAYTGLLAGIWKNTSAITSVDFNFVSTQTFMAGSTLTLYGVL